MIAYPGRTFGQLDHRMVKNNPLRTGKVNISGHEIDLAAIKVPVLVFAGNTDGIAPIPSVKAIVPLLSNAEEVRFEIVPGGHLGMLTGRAARRTTWVVMDEWIARYSTPDERDAGAAPKAAPTSSTKSAASRRTSKATRPKTAKTATGGTSKKAAGRSKKQPSPTTPPSAEVAPDRGAIGSNPERRYSSGASRGLAPKR
jgi:polyhydroxyalkanoate synthase